MKVHVVLPLVVGLVVCNASVLWAEAGKPREKKAQKAPPVLSAEEMFAQVDANKDKVIELSELMALKQLKGDEARGKKVLAAWDDDKDGKVSLEEFKKFAAAQEKARAEQAAKLDTNGDKVLSAEELRALKQLGGDETRLKAMMERLDDNKDGKISLEEFARFRNLLQVTPAPRKRQ